MGLFLERWEQLDGIELETEMEMEMWIERSYGIIASDGLMALVTSMAEFHTSKAF